MSGIKAIALAFLSLGESTHSPEFAQFFKAFPSSGQELVCIRLMSHIPDDLILRKIQRKMQGHRKLNCAQIGSQMSAVDTDRIDQKVSDLLCQFPVILRIKLLDIIGFGNLF